METYLELIGHFPLRPLKNDDDHSDALDVVERLLSMEAHTTDQSDYLTVLTMIIHEYEDVHYQVEHISGRDLLRFLMTENELTQTELASKTNLPKSSISMMLSGKRAPSIATIKVLGDFFKVDPEIFIDG